MAEDSLQLLAKFFHAASSNERFPRSNYATIARELCDKAPVIAQFLAEEIFRHLKDDGESDGVVATLGTARTSSPPRKRKRKQSKSACQPHTSAQSRQHNDNNAVQPSGEGVPYESIASEFDSFPASEARRNRTIERLARLSPLENGKDVDAEVDRVGSDIIPVFEEKLASTGQTAAPDSCRSLGDSGHKANPWTSRDTLDANKRADRSQLDPVEHRVEMKQSTATEPAWTSNESSTQMHATGAHESKNRTNRVLRIVPAGPEQLLGEGADVEMGVETSEDGLFSAQDHRGATTDSQGKHIKIEFVTSSVSDGTSVLEEPINRKEPEEPEEPEEPKTPGPATLPISTYSSSKPNEPQVTQDDVPSTPKGPIDRDGKPTPRTEEVLRVNESSSHAAFAPKSPLSTLQTEAVTFHDLLCEVVEVVAMMSSCQDALDGCYSAILAGLQASISRSDETDVPVRSGAIWTATDSKAWSGSMWIRILNAGESASHKTTVLTMIGYMGASIWYDAQVQELEKAPPRTKRGRPMKRVTSVLLDNLLQGEQHEQHGTNGRRRRLTLGTTQDSLVTGRAASIQEGVVSRRRKQIIQRVSKGRKLRTMVSKTGLGILLREKIWDYAKMTDDEFDAKVAQDLGMDPQKKSLLPILEDQIKILVNEGRTNLSAFITSLESRSIIPPKEVFELRAKFGLETEAVPRDYVDGSVDRLAGRVRLLLDKADFDEEDMIKVNGAVDLPCSSLHRFRPGAWLDMWTIAAAMEMADKPPCVKYGLSIPLDQDKDGRITPIVKPFGLWKRKIDEYRRSDARLIYFCPLSMGTNHFTLLEINEQLRMIYHYDSMARPNIVQGRARPTRVRLAVEDEFQDLGFGYAEAPCPQQKDDSSCGLMVIRNATLRMNGSKVGDWDDMVNPERFRLELVHLLEAGLRNDALHPKAGLRRSKRNGTVNI